MVRKVLKAGHSTLRETSKPVKKVDKEVKELIRDLKDTLVVQEDPEGVGLAAPQIGENLRIFVMRHNKKLKTIINPEVLSKKEGKRKKKKKKNKKASTMEGCLSIPHYYGPIRRAESLELEYMNEKGEKVKEEFKGFPAQIVEHEIDHLDGVLFVDRLLEQKKPLFKLNENEEWEEVDFGIV